MTFLDCYPFFEKDPFIVVEAPHVYFVGNQPEFAHKSIQGKTHT